MNMFLVLISRYNVCKQQLSLQSDWMNGFARFEALFLGWRKHYNLRWLDDLMSTSAKIRQLLFCNGLSQTGVHESQQAPLTVKTVPTCSLRRSLKRCTGSLPPESWWIRELPVEIISSTEKSKLSYVEGSYEGVRGKDWLFLCRKPTYSFRGTFVLCKLKQYFILISRTSVQNSPHVDETDSTISS